MLHKFRSTEMNNVLDEVTGRSDLINVFVCAKLASDGCLPESPSDFYAYPWPHAKFWLIIKRNKFIRPTVLIREAELVGDEDIADCLDAFLPQMLAAIDYHNEFLLLASTRLVDEISRRLEKINAYPYITFNSHGRVYYMNGMALNQALHMDLKPPEGFRFVDLNPALDPATIVATSQWSTDGDEQMIGARLKSIPSAAIATMDDRLASFEMLDGCGFFTLQYTFPEYRRRGLGTIIELELARLCAEFGLPVSKCVGLSRPHVIAMTERSPFWTPLLYDGLPLEFTYKAFSKVKKPLKMIN